MIRLAFRQFRAEAVIALIALCVVAVVLAVTGPNLVHVFRTTAQRLGNTDRTLQGALGVLLVVTPVILGVFFGAPIVARELETGTFRLAWTQSVSRSRWIVVKLALAGLVTAAVTEALSLMGAWWANPIDITNQNRFSPANFGMFGLVPFGYALFAFALGATTGVVFRRTLPAMATTFAGYIAARFAVTFWIRPHFEAPLEKVVRLTASSGFGINRTGGNAYTVTVFPPQMRNAWPLSASVVDKAGHAPSAGFLTRICPTLLSNGGGPPGGGPVGGGPFSSAAPVGGPRTCITKLARHFHMIVTYQPASRYWLFQIDETVLFVVLAAALAAASVWWVRRHLV